MAVTIEVCLDSVELALAAKEGGVDRVELCDNLLEGGTTPGPGTIQVARKYLEIDLNVIIRPRGGGLPLLACGVQGDEGGHRGSQGGRRQRGRHWASTTGGSIDRRRTADVAGCTSTSKRWMRLLRNSTLLETN